MTIPQADFKEYGLWLLRRRRLFTVVNQSMQPTLNPGDKVFVDPSRQAKQSLQLGDIVVAQHPLNSKIKIIKRVQEVFYDGNYYLVSDNLSDLMAQDSRKFGPVGLDLMIGLVTSFFYQSSSNLIG